MTKGSEYYHWYKAAGICPKCKSAPVAKGRSACPNCLDAEAERQRRRRDSATDAEKEAMCDKASATKAALYQRRKEQGLCVACGREFHTTTDKRLMCSDCIRAKTIKDAEIRHLEKVRKSRKTRKASGLSIAEIVRLAADKHMSYGEYVSKYGGA